MYMSGLSLSAAYIWPISNIVSLLPLFMRLCLHDHVIIKLGMYLNILFSQIVK